MARQAGEKFDAREFEKYMRNFDRTAFGMGSDRDPPTDRFSGKDIRIMFDEGRKMGGSKAEIAQDVLDYAADYKDVTKMGGTAESVLDRLRGYLPEESVVVDPVVDPVVDNEVIPVPFPVRQEQATYAPFRGSYFDFVGGDPSNPADYYMGDPDRGGTMQYFGDEKFLITDGSPAAVVPEGKPSFIRAIQNPSYISTFGLQPDEDEDKGYETEEDRVSREMSDGLDTVARAFRYLDTSIPTI
tara:strand:- start:145 stop:870 length:726 start_codon:yes stop_codon:yes gene_type:complete